MDNWWWKKQKNLPVKATIIPILLTSDKTVISLKHENQILWLVYITIDHLDIKYIKVRTGQTAYFLVEYQWFISK